MSEPQRTVQGFKTCLFIFFLFSWLHMLWLTHVYLTTSAGSFLTITDTVFRLAAWLFYSLVYLTPALMLTLAVSAAAGKLRRLVSPAVAFLSTCATLLLVRADSMIYDLYAFHINSFVLNLIVTPGGIASLGSGQESVLSFGLIILQILALQACFLWITLYLPCLRLNRRRHVLPICGLFLGLFMVQGTVYGISDINNFGPVLDGSKAFPLFRRVRFRSLAEHFGISHMHRSEFAATSGDNVLHYPRAEVPFETPATSPNIIVLVAESLRWDQLDQDTMPNTWNFSKRAQRFTRHYSSGNGTREGLFGMFYGLYGSYWESFMAARQQPLVMQRLQELGYDFDVRTSATFTYPEFDKTLFAGLPPVALHTANPAIPAWERDRINTDELLTFLETRASTHPFFEFFFFESTHAPYSFPEEHALHPDYRRDVDYADLSRAALAADIGPLYRRYGNAAHWVDSQLGRIYEKLQREGLLENTIVIVTGDHGEEFMEKGAWGHNSAFVEEQTHVPFVLATPGNVSEVTEGFTSHLDIGTTLLQILGAGGPPANYTLGTSLLIPEPRDHLVLSDWHSIGIVSEELKYRIPYLNLSGADYWAPTDGHDRPLAATEAELLTTRYRDTILATMKNCTIFTSHSVD